MSSSKSALASSATQRIYLGDDDTQQWVEFKSRLSWGERKQLEVAMFCHEQGGSGSVQVDFAAPIFQRMAVYIVAWNLYDDEQRPIRWPDGLIDRLALVQELDEDVGELIATALDTMLANRDKPALAEAGDESSPTHPSGPVLVRKRSSASGPVGVTANS